MWYIKNYKFTQSNFEAIQLYFAHIHINIYVSTQIEPSTHGFLNRHIIMFEFNLFNN